MAALTHTQPGRLFHDPSEKSAQPRDGWGQAFGVSGQPPGRLALCDVESSSVENRGREGVRGLCPDVCRHTGEPWTPTHHAVGVDLDPSHATDPWVTSFNDSGP